MAVRKREWTNGKGEAKSAWIVDYTDAKGVRRLKTFAKKKDADAFAAVAKIEVREGTHVADRDSATIRQAGKFWIAAGEAAGLERSSIDQRKQHLKFHIEPLIGNVLLSKLNVPAARDFEDRLRAEGRSPAMVKKVLGSLGGIFADAMERGLATRNPVRDMRGARRKGKERAAEKRAKGKLKVGIDIPLPDEVRQIIGHLEGRWRPLVLTAIFTGLRSSELRGLRWQDVDFAAMEIHVVQRADRYDDIGRPKSGAGERKVPLPPLVANALREWKLACPRRDTGRLDGAGNEISELHFVFPNGHGNTESHGNIVNRGLIPPQIAAGLTIDTGEVDDEGNPVHKAKYTGLHALRHFYASWCINRPEDGGLGLPPKMVQERLGHSSITMTLDTYGHLFPKGDDGSALAAAEALLMGR